MLERACMGDAELLPGERFQLMRFFKAVFVRCQCAYFRYRQGALGGEYWKTFRTLLRSLWRLRGKEVARLWEQFKVGGFLHEEFTAEVEKLRDEAQPHLKAMIDEGLDFNHA